MPLLEPVRNHLARRQHRDKGAFCILAIKQYAILSKLCINLFNSVEEFVSPLRNAFSEKICSDEYHYSQWDGAYGIPTGGYVKIGYAEDGLQHSAYY